MNEATYFHFDNFGAVCVLYGTLLRVVLVQLQYPLGLSLLIRKSGRNGFGNNHDGNLV